METYGEMSVRFMSESIIRAVINYVDTSQTLSQVGTDLEKIVFFQRSLDEESLKTLDKKLMGIAQADGYEEMLTVRNKDIDATLLGKGEMASSDGVIVVMRNDDETYVFFEIVGSVNLGYFTSMFTSGDGLELGKQLGDIQKLLDFDLGF